MKLVMRKVALKSEFWTRILSSKPSETRKPSETIIHRVLVLFDDAKLCSLTS